MTRLILIIRTTHCQFKVINECRVITKGRDTEKSGLDLDPQKSSSLSYFEPEFGSSSTIW